MEPPRIILSKLWACMISAATLIQSIATAQHVGSLAGRAITSPNQVIRPAVGATASIVHIPPHLAVGFDTKFARHGDDYTLRIDGESFYHGPENGLPITNLTVHTKEPNARILSAGRFEKILNSAKCTNDSVELHFAKEVEFQKIRADWSWVNAAEHNYVILVTTSSHCDVGPQAPGYLQPWHIKEAEFKDAENKVILAAEAREPRDVFKDWHFKANSRGILPHSRDRRDVKKGVDFNWTIPEVGFGVGTGAAGMGLIINGEIESLNPPEGAILCEGCSIWGSMDVALDFKTNFNAKMFEPHPEGLKHLKSLLTGSMKITSHGIGAYIGLNASMYKADAKISTKEVIAFSAPVPIAGIYEAIGSMKLFQMGLGVQLVLRADIGGNPKPVTVSTGYNVTLIDESSFEMDIQDPRNFDASGWKPHIQKMEPAFSDGASLIAKFGQQLRLVLATEVSSAGAETGFIFEGGEVSLNAQGIRRPNSCGKKGAQAGVELEIDVAEQLGAFASAGVGRPSAAVTQIAPMMTSKVYSHCMPITNARRLPWPTSLPTPSLQSFLTNTNDAMGAATSAASVATSEAKSVASTVTSEATAVASAATSEVKVVESKATSSVQSVATAAASGVKDAESSMLHGIGSLFGV